MRDFMKLPAQSFRFFNARGADEDWPTGPVHIAYFFDDRDFFLSSGAKDHIRMIDTNHRAICRNHFDVKAINRSEFLRLSRSSPRHPANGRIQRHQVLQRYRTQNAPLLLCCNAFLGFDGCV